MENGNDWFQKHVVESLERLENGQTTMLAKFEDHSKSDATQFEAIRLELATNKAEHEATAKTEAKFWSVIGTGIGAVFSAAVHYLGKH